MRVDATTDGGGCGRTDRCLHELAKLEEMGLERAEEMYLAVIDLIRREQPNIIPYRRRGFESDAAVAEILNRNGAPTPHTQTCYLSSPIGRSKHSSQPSQYSQSI